MESKVTDGILRMPRDRKNKRPNDFKKNRGMEMELILRIIEWIKKKIDESDAEIIRKYEENRKKRVIECH